MRLSDYAFGRIRVDGQLCTTDLIVYPDRLEENWRRRNGHRLAPEDLEGVLKRPPKVLVVGTGFSGCMAVAAETIKVLEVKGIEVRAYRTGDAAREFNRLKGEKSEVVAALHLTC